MNKTEFNNWNRQIIEEFRANKGKVGGPFEGAPMLLLTTTGAKSGKQYTTPLVYLPDSNRLIIFASKAGAPTNPDWYHNLVAHPQVTIEVGTETLNVTATVINGEERDQLFNKQAEISSRFADYQAKTTRQIPVIALQ
ncbi:MAG TPA: nitroreductase family deazaflavin-dependent oxidoreductase [Ktedonobacteraceae bacterium]|jgi:deazaflavin-dependent oxidoreductase (nitroreductase family)|nr:nitroreductase family deazaflavin-dependent oxidoreductase [Ktedonobacteraceae bacterium]